MLNSHLQEIVTKATGANAITETQVLQTLWSDYGKIVRVGLSGSAIESAVLKYIVFPKQSSHSHPRGWNTQTSHKRKIKSYDVEMHWYRDWSAQCDGDCRVARCYAAEGEGDERVIVLEDLDASGFSARYPSLNKEGVKQCLRWLAYFHGKFMGVVPRGLWEIGTYWHLQTRPDELEAMGEGALKQSAAEIDQLLNACEYQTLVHGDAKVANFCFSPDQSGIAAVDFQYVGGGCGMKDVAYLMGSCLDSQRCELWQDELLDYYFSELKKALDKYNKKLAWEALENEWRQMFPIAWTDFYRFVSGWMPTHHKINDYTKRLAAQVLAQIG